MAGLAARLYLGAVGAPRRYLAWGQAIRGAVLALLLPTGGCGASNARLSAPGPDFPGVAGACYGKTGTQVTFTSAAVTLYLQPSGSQPLQHSALWGLTVTVPGAEAAALTAITTKAFDTQDSVAISIAGTTWAVISTAAPLTNGRFVFMTQSKNQALQLQRTLVPSD